MTTTTTCPASHTELAAVCVGKEYGHVAGHQYRDVHVMISRNNRGYRCQIVEVWGQNRGCDEEEGRREVVERAGKLLDAASVAGLLAERARISDEYLSQALSQAVDIAQEEDDANHDASS